MSVCCLSVCLSITLELLVLSHLHTEDKLLGELMAPLMGYCQCGCPGGGVITSDEVIPRLYVQFPTQDSLSL